MMSNPLVIELMIKERQQSLIQDAREISLAGRIETNKKTVVTKIIERFANLLISIGEYLKKKYSPESILELSEEACACNG